MTTAELEAMVLKTVLSLASASGRRIAEQVRLPFKLLESFLQSLKRQMFLSHKAAAVIGDYEYVLTEVGMERARRFSERCTYFGAAPVPLDDYVRSIPEQSVRAERPRMQDLCRAFSDLTLAPAVVSQIGQAVNAGRGLFLYGAPGNGKTSIAERVMRSVSQELWIPRTVTVGGEIIRLYDPSSHFELPPEEDTGRLSTRRPDGRWVKIKRPTIVVGGELTLAHLEITTSSTTGIHESPVQFKSNGGALVVDDFGRQRCSTAELLNRWIVPLEKGYDYLALPSGRQIQVPFDQLLVFATNLEPRQLVDEAFLRRIPYKIEVLDPTDKQFREMFLQQAIEYGFHCDEQAVSYLVGKHFTVAGRAFRYCHVRDLLSQIKNFCEFHERPLEIIPETIDIAVTNYFAGL